MATVSKPVKQFDYESIPLGASILVIGKRYSGKSTIVDEMVCAMAHKFQMAFLLAGTEGRRERFQKILPKWCVGDVSVEHLEKLLHAMKTRYTHKRKTKQPTENWLLVLDDTAFDKEFMGCKAMRELYANGRNFGCTVILVVQYLKTAPPLVRTNTDFMFAMWEAGENERKFLHDICFNCIPKTEFLNVFKTCTADFGALVYDSRKVSSDDWRSKVYWKRANYANSQRTDFRIGYPSMFVLDKCFIAEPETSFQSLPAIPEGDENDEFDFPN